MKSWVNSSSGEINFERRKIIRTMYLASRMNVSNIFVVKSDGSAIKSLTFERSTSLPHLEMQFSKSITHGFAICHFED